MGFIENLKGVANLISEVDNISLKNDFISLQQSALELILQNSDLIEENRKLKEELLSLEDKMQVQDNIILKDKAYWHNEDGPFCMKCYDIDKELRRVVKKDKLEMHCPSCDYKYRTEDQENEYSRIHSENIRALSSRVYYKFL